MSDLPSSVTESRATGNITDAPKPFDSSAKRADVILRSQDSKDFYVSKTLLSIASPVFDDMFGQGGDEDGEKMPVIPVEEHSVTLYNLLLLVYPYSQKPSSTIDMIDMYFEMAKAAKKYDMEDADKKIRELITVSDTMGKEPLRVYVIAVLLGWEDVMKVAAYATLEVPLRDLCWCQELESVNASHYHKLLQWRFACCDAVNHYLTFSCDVASSARDTIQAKLATTMCPRSGALINGIVKTTLLQSSRNDEGLLKKVAERIDKASLNVILGVKSEKKVFRRVFRSREESDGRPGT